jgi:hypothetical protein
VTADDFRRLALSFPEATESAHMGHPDFRVGDKIFATLGWPDGGWGMIKLTRDEQELFVAEDPEAFRPVTGSWGRQGNTNVRLEVAVEEPLRSALAAAWRNAAPKRLSAPPR